ncbi:hypothetical protein SAMN05216223_105403 [Actinacidiphila yanglinensis]|uniref:Copper(I)-binding protein n=1 Tax=Actinacidiphila yanglinensis TaxID=310779 RepID=A0A1H6AIU3_9ACTN|nr:hypothetical protein [Actinacidiphila yanglinensis]SEG47945.1 hypothetical protein SAMN05216223_105403 [Actinacidiphila yanglinensis]
MSRNRRTAARAFRASGAVRTARAIAVAAVLAGLVTACSDSGSGSHATPAETTAAPDTPGQVTVHEDDVDLTITDAVAHLDGAGNGTLTMAVRNDSGVPEHLDMVGAPDAGRGTLAGSTKGVTGDSGSMMDAGIYLPTGTTVTFGGTGPTVTFTAVHGVTAAHTLPLILQFGVARLVHLSARVTTTG